MTIKWRCSGLALLLISINVNAAEAVDIGLGLEGYIHEPIGEQRGQVIIAPGAGYNMDQSLFVDMAVASARQGYWVLRFNWRYYTAGKSRGENIDAEAQDLIEAISFLNDKANGNQPLMLIGKSLGSVVVARVAKETHSPSILLTPICRSGPSFKETYQHTGKIMVMISGDKDPLCKHQILYNNSNSSNKIVIVKGDHGYNSQSREQSVRNKSLVLKTVSYWLESQRDISTDLR